MIELPRPPFALARPKMKVFGIGNAGCNALDRIVLDGATGIDAVAVNTDAQILASSVAPHKLQIGQTITRGLGAGGDPDLGRTAAEEGIGEILGGLADANIVFIVVGLGGGTGSGAAPVVAEVAREHGAMIVVLATMPFAFEGKRRIAQADASLAALRQSADLLLCFENDHMGDAVAPNAPIQEAFAVADRTLSECLRALAAFTGRKGLVHTGFDEVATSCRGAHVRSVFGFGAAAGENRAHQALESALRNPLLNRARLKDDVENVIVSIAGGPDLTLNEIQILMTEFQRHVRERTRIFFGAAVQPELAGTLTVSILGSFEVAPPADVPLSPALPARTQRGAILAPAPRREVSAPPARNAQVDIGSPTEAKTEAIPPAVHESEANPEVVEPAVPRPALAPLRNVLPPRAPVPASTSTPPPRPPRSKELRVEQMQLEPVNRGRFEKSEPTIVDGEDLDVPSFLRRNPKPR